MPRIKNKGGHPGFPAHPLFVQRATTRHSEDFIPPTSQSNGPQQSGSNQTKDFQSYDVDDAPRQQHCANQYGDSGEPSSDLISSVSCVAQPMAPTPSWPSAIPGTEMTQSAMPDPQFLGGDTSTGWPINPLPSFPMQPRQDVHCNAPGPFRHDPMASPVAPPMQMQETPQQWPPQQTAHAGPRAVLPRPTPGNPITDEDFREYLARLGAPREKFQPQEHSVGRPRECGLAAPKQQNYAPEDFERAQRYYRKYHNAWRNFHSAKSKLGEASAQDKGRLQKLTLKNAELLKDKKEDYLSFNRTGLPLKSSASPEQRQKRLTSLREKVECSRQKIKKTEKSLSEGKITPEEAAASLQRQKHWKAKMEGEIADIDYELQHEGTLPDDVQPAPENAYMGNMPPARAGFLSQESSDYSANSVSDDSSGFQMGEPPDMSLPPQQLIIPQATTSANVSQFANGNPDNDMTSTSHVGPSSQEYANNFLANIDPVLLAGGNGIQEVPNAHIHLEHVAVSPDAAHFGHAGAPVAMDQNPPSLIPEEYHRRSTIPTNGSGLDPSGSSILVPGTGPTGMMTCNWEA